MAVEKHLLQNWQKRVQLLQLPEALGWLPLSLGLLGRVQHLGTPLGQVARGSLGQLLWLCREQRAVSAQALRKPALAPTSTQENAPNLLC